MRNRPHELTAPHPNRGWSSDLLNLDHAFVVPPERDLFVQPAGVLRSDGSYCPRAAVWRRHRPITSQPDHPGMDIPTLPGKWLWGGVLFGHFGHFVVESTSRLWPLPKLADQIDGVIFIQKRPRLGDTLHNFQNQMIRLFGANIPIKVIIEPTRVEKLFVPGQGFGLGRIVTGTPIFKDAIKSHFSAEIGPKGGKKLYISRSEISLSRGTIVGEKILEYYLFDHGYEIFHPQDHDLVTQIARYKAAEVILGSEGSALHMVAMVARPDQKIGIIVRRRSSATDFIEKHLRSFSGRKPSVLDCITRTWAPIGERRKHTWLGEHNLSRLQAQLQREKFINFGGDRWPSFVQNQVQAVLGETYEIVSRKN